MRLGVFWRYLGNSAVYYPKLANVTGGVTACVFFWQLFHWQSQLSNPNQWVKITADEIENETGLNRLEQELARKQLIERSLLKERLVNGHSDMWEFWADIDALEKRLKADWEPGFNDASFKPTDKISLQESKLSKREVETHSNQSSSGITPETPVKSVTREAVNSDRVLDRNLNPNLKQPPIEVEDSQSSSITSSPAVNRHWSSNTNGDSAHPQTRRVKTDKFFPVRRQPVAVKITPNYQFTGPWESPEQFEAFQRALWDYFKHQGVENPSGWVFRVIDGMTKGLVSPFWDEFVAGIPLGETQKVMRDWEVEPGIPYPAFEEERTQYYLHKGEPLEVAVARARSDLRDPVLGKDLWEGFLRKCDRIADEGIKAKQLGVSTPYLPPSFTNKPQVTKQSVINKLSAISPQLSLASSSSDFPNLRSLEQQKTEQNNSTSVSDIPPLSALQNAYKNPMGRTLVEKQIAEHPEWGYGIVDGQVVDLFPF